MAVRGGGVRSAMGGIDAFACRSAAEHVRCASALLFDSWRTETVVCYFAVRRGTICAMKRACTAAASHAVLYATTVPYALRYVVPTCSPADAPRQICAFYALRGVGRFRWGSLKETPHGQRRKYCAHHDCVQLSSAPRGRRAILERPAMCCSGTALSAFRFDAVLKYQFHPQDQLQAICFHLS